ncbi:MAG: MipA/OmpV family protein [Candidatus Omnitrophica bacterium]|nr:MipA/OmpV family protein [Candidatus Omnitrophota bacterium]
MKRSKIIFLIFFFIFSFQSICHAVELFEGVWRAFDLEVEELEGVVLGFGVLYSTSVYEGVDDSVWAVPIIVGKYKRFYVDGSSLGYILNDRKDFYLSLVVQPRFGGYDHDDSSTLAGMDDRKWSLEGGLRLTWNNDLFLLNITGVNDLLGRYDGHEVKAIFSRDFLKGTFTPKVGVKWLSDNLVEYYYGVTGSEATSARPVYEGGSTVNFIAGFSVAFPLGDKWAITGDFEYETLGSEIEDSPIVDESDDFTTVAGLVYRF